MRRIIFTLSLLVSLFALQSCKVAQLAPFTTVEAITKVKIGDNLQSVIATLGVNPYNFYSSVENGYTIYSWEFKKLERNINPEVAMQKGGEVSGDPRYNSKAQSLYCIFSKDYKLLAMYSSDGRKETESLAKEHHLIKKLIESGSCFSCLDEQPVVEVEKADDSQQKANINMDLNLKLQGDGSGGSAAPASGGSPMGKLKKRK